MQVSMTKRVPQSPHRCHTVRFERHVIFRCPTPFFQARTRWRKGLAGKTAQQTHQTPLPLDHNMVLTTQTQQLATHSQCSVPYDRVSVIFIVTIILHQLVFNRTTHRT